MKVCEPTASLCTALEFVAAANQTMEARVGARPEVAEALARLGRELHSVACKVGLVSRLRGDQRLVFDIAIATLEDRFVDEGVWQTAPRSSHADHDDDG